MAKRVNVRLVSVALLPALGVSVVSTVVGMAIGLSESTAERISQILFFPVFLGACHAWRHRFEPEATRRVI